MRAREQLLEIMDRVCADVRVRAVNAAEVPERLVVVAGSTASVAHPEGVDVYEGGGVIAFVNDSGVPFVEQAEQLIAKAVTLRPEAVLLGGSALIGRPGGVYRRILAVQLFSVLHGIRAVKVADVGPPEGLIRSVGRGGRPRPVHRCGRRRSWPGQARRPDVLTGGSRVHADGGRQEPIGLSVSTTMKTPGPPRAWPVPSYATRPPCR